MESPQREFERTWQPRLWLSLAALILIVAYLIAFVVGNSEETSVNFVFASATTSLIWVILLSLLAGLVGGVLVSQVYARRRALTGTFQPHPEPESEPEPEPDAER